MTDRELLQQALDARESGSSYDDAIAFNAIRARLAQPAQKPLTDEDWFNWWQVSSVMDNTQAEIDFADFILIARAIEAAHEIKS